MTFNGLNLVGVLIASVVSIVSGAIWFGPKTFYPIWMKARGNETGRLQNNPNPGVLFGGTFVSVLIQTLSLGIIINSLQVHLPEFGVIDGAGVGLVLGVGIAMFASLPHRLFGGENFKTWMIETLNDSLNLMIAGAIIAALN
ncbi:MAG: DUF1761 domain-containing protein, partial [Actinobacteria bacterium]|jgi:hypothetical protein|nr:DUF1761 domain-containing protein [Actinomycetota bacterium]